MWIRAFDHICVEKARYKFLIIIISSSRTRPRAYSRMTYHDIYEGHYPSTKSNKQAIKSIVNTHDTAIMSKLVSTNTTLKISKANSKNLSGRLSVY